MTIDQLISEAVAKETKELRLAIDKRIGEITTLVSTIKPERNPHERLKLKQASKDYGIPLEVLRQACKEGYIDCEPQCLGNDNLFLIKRKDLEAFDVKCMLGLPPKRRGAKRG